MAVRVTSVTFVRQFLPDENFTLKTSQEAPVSGVFMDVITRSRTIRILA
ncbi:MAG: hypothetical protein LBK99_05380 [Opitutaceae bacterium]|jgi:hypothetical protein|nr:hypothetical protein [Opitutaceae bacterium]